MIVWSISGHGGEEEMLDGAPGSGDAWYGCRDAKLSVCVPENPVVFLFFVFFPPLDHLQSNQRHQASPGFGYECTASRGRNVFNFKSDNDASPCFIPCFFELLQPPLASINELNGGAVINLAFWGRIAGGQDARPGQFNVAEIIQQ